jgi:histone arginine demethylase JMJD6
MIDENSVDESRKLIYLSPDERYDIWIVKAAERSELLLHSSRASDSDSDDNDNESVAQQALQDGCDIPGWRRAGIIDTESSTEAALKVGPGCTLLRRETQLPLVSTRSRGRWMRLKQSLQQVTSTIPRLEYYKVQEINPWFERENTPVLITGCSENWQAMKTCTFSHLVARFGDVQWRFSDTHAETMTLTAYQRYIFSIEGRTDDAPLAIYDSQFDTDERKVILDEYYVPSCFDTDLFRLIDDGNQRPPFRWILIGPERSGTGLHIDPVGTHAWVTLIEGCKRWVLFPPSTPAEMIFMQDPQIPSVIWFRDHYDAVIRKFPEAVEVVQYSGETVYVPAGWPHLVLNLELSVAITENYATEYPSMDQLRTAVKDAEPALAENLLTVLKMKRPELIDSFSSTSTCRKEDEVLELDIRTPYSANVMLGSELPVYVAASASHGEHSVLDG